MYTIRWYSFYFYIASTQKQNTMNANVKVGDLLESPKFGWIYQVEMITDGVATLQDVIRKNIRVKFTLNALADRIEKNSFVHIPQHS